MYLCSALKSNLSSWSLPHSVILVEYSSWPNLALCPCSSKILVRLFPSVFAPYIARCTSSLIILNSNLL